MYVTNRHHFGHLVESSRFTTTRYHNDMYQLFDNKLVSMTTMLLSYLCLQWELDPSHVIFVGLGGGIHPSQLLSVHRGFYSTSHGQKIISDQW